MGSDIMEEWYKVHNKINFQCIAADFQKEDLPGQVLEYQDQLRAKTSNNLQENVKLNIEWLYNIIW